MRRLLIAVVCFAYFGLVATAQDTEWSDWRSTPNFPGIQIRVVCKIYLPAGNVSNWEYQFLNNYRTRVEITYRDEKRESTPQKLIPSTPNTFFLRAGEKSDVYDNYVVGNCDRKLYIAVDKVEVDGGAKITPRTGSGFSTRATGLAAGDKKTSVPAADKGSSFSKAAEGSTVGGAEAQHQVEPRGSTPGGLANTEWSCTLFEKNINIVAGTHAEGREVRTDRYTFDFHPDGSYSCDDCNVTNQDYRWTSQSYRWHQSGSSVQWTTFNQTPRLVEGNVSGDRMTAQMGLPQPESDGGWRMVRYECALTSSAVAK